MITNTNTALMERHCLEHRLMSCLRGRGKKPVREIKIMTTRLIKHYLMTGETEIPPEIHGRINAVLDDMVRT